MVLEIRREELQEERQKSEKLAQRCERLYYLETELGKARQRVEEMNIVVQNKMVAEKELLDISEALTNDLGTSRQEVLSLRRQIENRQYLHMHTNGAMSVSPVIVTQQQPCSTSTISDYSSLTEDSGLPSPESSQQRNQHQKARCEILNCMLREMQRRPYLNAYLKCGPIFPRKRKITK